MIVICDQCAARYEFDAADIPAEGYDAQCTSCGHVFFVQPEGTEPATDAVAEAAQPEVDEPDEPIAAFDDVIEEPAGDDAEPSAEPEADGAVDAAGDDAGAADADEDDGLTDQIDPSVSFDDMLALSTQAAEGVAGPVVTPLILLPLLTLS